MAPLLPPCHTPLLSRIPDRFVPSPVLATLLTSPGSLLMYLFGVLFIRNFVLVFILTLILLSVDFYYLKNIAGRRLVGLRWWNEVNTSTGESHWVFESAEPGTRTQNATDKRFFWLSMYIAPALWVGLAVLAVVRLQSVIWLVEVGEYIYIQEAWSVANIYGIAIALALVLTNTVAFSRCDKFSQASSLAGNAFSGAGIARSLAGNMMGRLFK